MIKCDICKKGNKGHYLAVSIDGKFVTFCDDCRYGKTIIRNVKSQSQIFDELQIPFWKLMGQKPKPQDIKLEKYLKSRNMTYGDWRRERDHYEAKYPSALNSFYQHQKKYGRNNAPASVYQTAQKSR